MPLTTHAPCEAGSWCRGKLPPEGSDSCLEIMFPLSFREEAKKLWEKREEEWEREKKARDRLMNEVMALCDEVSLGSREPSFQLQPPALRRVTACRTQGRVSLLA